MMTTQNASSEAQVQNFFFNFFYVRSQDIQVFVFLTIPMIYQICVVTMSVST